MGNGLTGRGEGLADGMSVDLHASAAQEWTEGQNTRTYRAAEGLGGGGDEPPSAPPPAALGG